MSKSNLRPIQEHLLVEAIEGLETSEKIFTGVGIRLRGILMAERIGLRC